MFCPRRHTILALAEEVSDEAAPLLSGQSRDRAREAVRRRLHLRLQAHAARAVERQQSEADQNRQHLGYLDVTQDQAPNIQVDTTRTTMRLAST